jgi:hypothetical protein
MVAILFTSRPGSLLTMRRRGQDGIGQKSLKR